MVDVEFSIGICGLITNPDPKYNPYAYCESTTGSELIRRLCSGPVPVREIDAELPRGMELIEAVRVEEDKCYLNFPCFLSQDQTTILRGWRAVHTIFSRHHKETP